MRINNLPELASSNLLNMAAPKCVFFLFSSVLNELLNWEAREDEGTKIERV